MSYNRKAIGLVRLLVHKSNDIVPWGYEILESNNFQYDFYFQNMEKSRPYEDWMSELINEGNHSDFYNDVFKDIKQDEFYAEIIAELHAAWGYTGGEYNEYDEDFWFENERFHILTDQDVKKYYNYRNPVEKPDIVFQENNALEE